MKFATKAIQHYPPQISYAFAAVQKFWKSIKIWQRHREFKGGNFFWDTVDIMQQYSGFSSSIKSCTQLTL